MQTVTIGQTGLTVNKNGFGALPVQRVAKEEAVHLLRRAYDHGVNYFDTARAYSDSEEKLGSALADVRNQIVISTKTAAQTAEAFWTDLATSLKTLQTDYIDIYQLHNPAFCPKPGDGSGLYEAMVEAKAQGKIRHIGITNHRQSVAWEAIRSGLYETLQFPFSYLANAEDIAIAEACGAAGMGFIAMKGLAGGLINNAAAAYAFLAQYPFVAPIWGVQRECELDEFLAFQDNPPAMTAEIRALIAHDQQELAGAFCRGCGYCMPCPEGIQINNCARMSLMLRRAPSKAWTTAYWQEEMQKIEHCRHCGQCKSRCPYGLDTPALLEKNYADYQTFIR